MEPKVTIIGVGRLGEAVLAGLLRSGYPADALRGNEKPSDAFGIDVEPDNAAVVKDASVVLLAVPPDRVATVAHEIGPALARDAIVVSLAAGVPTSTVQADLSRANPVVRVMTNTAARVGEAMSAITPGHSATPVHVAVVRRLFERLGAVIEVPEQDQDTVTAIAGAGPMFGAYLAGAIGTVALQHELPVADAHLLAAQALYGAAALLKAGVAPAELVDQARTPGGVSEAAFEALSHHSVDHNLRKAVEAAIRRAGQLAQR
ncbi:pyrroline-5-carboxylate reductase family protein [Nonomuraea sp. NPDC050536]|uniref:pyrroline-5-carboxylate reductase family protein n=1 Tax=Nonomuraea sp. NPDC050536 TaxID=3364366 RepID=UPI0037CB95FE